MRGAKPLLALVAAGATALSASAARAACPPNAEPYRETVKGNEKTVHCRCVAGYESRNGSCKPVAVMREDTPQMQLQRLRNQAAEEWYWFTLNQFDVMTSAFWAIYGYNPQASQYENEDVESKWVEARQHLREYLRIQREIEQLQSGQTIAEQHFQERMQAYVVAPHGRHAAVDAAKGVDTPVDFAPWAKDADARHDGRCIFVGRAAELVCK